SNASEGPPVERDGRGHVVPFDHTGGPFDSYRSRPHASSIFGLGLVQSGAGLIAAQYEPTQNDFLKLRKQVFGRIVVEMKLLTWRERRALRKDPAWAIEDHSGLI